MARSKVRIVCAIGFLCAVSLSAQEVVRDTITGKVHQIEKVTVTARRLPNKVTSSVPIQTLSQQDISQLGIQNMADAVRRFAGANIRRAWPCARNAAPTRNLQAAEPRLKVEMFS